MAYIDTKYLFECETCRRNRTGMCDTWCESGECYQPDMSKIPTADVVEVVRCKDCEHSREIDISKSPEKYFRQDCVVCECESVVGDEPMIYLPTHFCSYGERQKEG